MKKQLIILVALLFLSVNFSSNIYGQKKNKNQFWKKMKKDAQNKYKKTQKKTKDWSDKQKKNLQKSYDKNKRNANDYYNKKSKELKQNANSYYNKKSNEYKQNANNYYSKKSYELNRKYNDYSKKYGENFAREYQDFHYKYGSNASNRLSKMTDKYGEIAARNIKEAYNKHGRDLGYRISRAYEKHGSEIAESIKESSDQYGPVVGTRISKLYSKYSTDIAEDLHRTYDQYGKDIGLEVEQTINTSYRKVTKYIKDPVQQKKAIDATIYSITKYRQLKDEMKVKTHSAISYAMNTIPVKDEDGNIVSLNEFTKNWIIEEAPYLKGTSIAEDPAEALTYIVVYRDIGYVVHDMNIIQNKHGEFVSIEDAAIENSPFNSNETIVMLNAVEGFETLANGDSSADEIILAANDISKLNQINNSQNLSYEKNYTYNY